MIFKTFPPPFPTGLLQKTFPSWKVHWVLILSKEILITCQNKGILAVILKEKSKNNADYISVLSLGRQ